MVVGYQVGYHSNNGGAVIVDYRIEPSPFTRHDPALVGCIFCGDVQCKAGIDVCSRFIAMEWGATEWAAIGQVVTALVAIVAAGVGWSQLREARRLREEQARPFVVVDIVPSRAWGSILNLVVENIGGTLAHDVQIRFDPPLESSQEKLDLQHSNLLQQGIPMLPPHRRVEAFFDVSHSRLKADLPLRYDVTVNCTDSRKRPMSALRYQVDIGFMVGLEQVREYGVHDAAKALVEMNKTMQKWNKSSSSLRVQVCNEDEKFRRAQIIYELSGRPLAIGLRLPSERWISAGRNPFIRPIVKFLYLKIGRRSATRNTA